MILCYSDAGFVLQTSPVAAGGVYPPFFYDLIYGTQRSRLYPTDTDEQLYEHLQQLDLHPLLQSYPTSPRTGLTFIGHQSTTPSVSGLGSNLLSLHLGQTLMLGSLESGLGARHRRCSSPSSFLHMIREDVSDCVGGNDLWPGVIDRMLRKTSLGLDDSSPVGGEWSRKTSSTSGYSEMADGSRKLSTASEEERLSTYSCSSRKASGASEEEQEQAERFLKGSDRVSKSKGRGSTDEGIAMVGEDAIQCGTDEDDIAGDKLVPMESIPAFQLVIHKADSEDSQNASSLQELE